MKAHARWVVALSFVAGCAAKEDASPRGLELRVAPLGLAGIGDACFDVRVTNGAGGSGDVVWSRGTPGLNGGAGDSGALCSGRYGDGGGDLTYIGPCDASGQLDEDPAGERTNSVTLWFDGLYDTSNDYLAPDGPQGWEDPCQAGCTLDVLCEENADALVRFDFTVMRDAKQGFFDVAVSFDDIFCSAKLDTCREGDARIELLFGADETRDWTAVFGFACSAGRTATQTMLHYGDVAVVCTSGATTTVFPLNTVGPTGNNRATSGASHLHYGVYRGAEALACDDANTPAVESCNKVYWNLAVSLDDLAALGTCTLAFGATATDGELLENGLPAGPGISYPYIEVAATLAPPTCQRHALNDGGAVRTAYRGTLGAPAAVMCSGFDGTAAGPLPGADCSDTCPNDPDKVRPGLCGCGTPDTDTDGDLSPDCSDACVNDPAKVSAGACGCGTAETDGDGDAAPDCVDQCPADPAKTSPGPCGCGLSDVDTDGDLTPDCLDTCPTDPDKVAAGVCDCGTPDTDSDGDGTPDCNDACASDPGKTAAGPCGCGTPDTDSDADGTPDCNDACPNDPAKLAVGLCGCGTPDTDSDGDGTPNCNDLCPNAPGKVAPGACGCGLADTDSDSDGTPDCNDLCPDDPAKVAQGVCGCGTPETDSDGDGTPNCNDLCPSDPAKVTQGICGCGTPETDSDGDGAPNCDDLCPSDPGKVTQGICGCGTPETDSDGDGTPNCNDLCPNDPGKVAPGTCGCAIADTDSDGDGTPNCNDLCPNDPGKVALGLCGCGTSDADSDGDGTPNCNDLCPNDPLKVAPGACGCGVANTDSDSDGTPNCNDLCPTDPLKTAPGSCGCGVPDAAGSRPGGTQSTAASSCVAILAGGGACGNGTYWIDPTGGTTTDAYQVYCDMTTDGGGWMKVESATYPFWFTSGNWESLNSTNPSSDNYSIIGRRNAFIDADGCFTFRLQVGQSGNWLSALAHKTVWKQCHDPFTQTTAGADYTFISGEAPTTCNGFNGLHHKYQGNSYTSDPDQNDSVNCWWMQVVPHTQYGSAVDWPGYLDGYGGSGNYHRWQSFWIRAAHTGKGREAPGQSCAALRAMGYLTDGTYWIDTDGGDNADAFKAYCDMTGGGWTRVIGPSTTQAELTALPVVANSINNFTTDATYGLSWGTFVAHADWDARLFKLDLDLRYNEIKVTHTGFYNSPAGGLGQMTIRNSGSYLLTSTDGMTDPTGGQTLIVGGSTIFSGSQTNIVNRTDTIAAANSTLLSISMNAYTSSYAYTRRYIKELWFR